MHEAKSRIFQDKLQSTPEPAARAGVVDAIRTARSRGDKVGFVTTTAPENVSAILESLRPDLGRDDFEVVVDSSQVARVKPDAAMR